MEDDLMDGLRKAIRKNFNPRPPHGGRRARGILYNSVNLISTHVLRMEDDDWVAFARAQHPISTHVLRMEDDHRPQRHQV